MRRSLLVVLIAAASAACIVGREEVLPDEQASAPPPEPAPDVDPGYQAQAPPPPPGTDISSDDVFYSDLAPYGNWVDVAPYGRVWVPSVGYGWRPYYYGQWVLTDWGWTFVSDDPWGWAAYHYGRWNFGVGTGWYWIPGRVWGPAWVSWRFGGGYAAWCPLGPDGVIFGYRHPAWVAVQQEHFTQPIRRVAVPVSATARVVTGTQPLSGPHAVARGGSFGPPVAGIQRAVGQPIARVPAAQVVGRARPTAAGPMRSPGQQPRVRAGSGGDVTRVPGQRAPRPYNGGGQAAPRPNGGGGQVVTRPYGGGGQVSRPRGGVAQPAPGGGARAAPAPAAPRGGAHNAPHAQEKSK
jgi:uncharacterized protein DUF6600